MRGRLVLLFLLLAGPTQQSQQAQQSRPAPFQRIAYQLAMPRPASHLFYVTISVEIGPGTPLAFVDFQIPLWQPGRYSVADFAKNVQEFSARAGGQLLPFEKTDDQTWRVRTQGNRAFAVTYKVFGNDLSGTYAQLDVTHANYTGGELFMYVAGHKQDPVELKVDPPAGWRVINGRTERPGQTQWMYPNYEILIDNPTEVGSAWTLDNFSVDGKTYHVVVHSRGDEGGRRPEVVRGLEKVVRAEVGMWGPPDFDQYTFMIHYAADDRSGDGMEHLTSTHLIMSGALADAGSYERTVETAAHEFFHVWNVKRLRPVEFGPWDWTRPANTKSLWIAEGFTEYYSNMMMRRAGLWDDDRLLRELGYVISNLENSPGSKLMSPVDASLAAPFIDSAVHRQRTNLENTSFTYYYGGESVGLILDLLIRASSHGHRSLDDVLTRMYDEFYVKSPNATYYLKGRGYTNEDFVRVLSEVAGSDMTGFYDSYIRGLEPMPFKDALEGMGLRLVKAASNRGYTAGIVLDEADSQLLRLGTLRNGSAAERAGLQQGDVLLSIAGVDVDFGNWRAIMNRQRLGDRVRVKVERFRRTVELSLDIGPPDSFNYTLEEISNASSEARALRAAWFAGKTD